MKVEIEVKRVRASVTQGAAHVYMNGHKVMAFGDDIKLVKEGEPYYGENIRGWASKSSDISFIRGLLCHQHEEIYKIHDKIGAVLDTIEAEEKDDPSDIDPLDVARKKRHEYIVICGGFGGIREADETYNDLNREEIEAFRKKYGRAFLGKRNYYGKEREEIIAGKRDVYTEYTGELVRNFACDFVVPRPDHTLANMIRAWNGDETLPKKYKDADVTTKYIESIGGFSIIWF